MIKLRTACYLVVLSLLCCRKPYGPPAINSPGSYLVVEGVINPGSDSTIIKLSKTVKLSSATPLNPALGATVTVESNQGSSCPLIDVNNDGNYSAAALNLPGSQQYRLKINTSDGRQYVSDFVPVKLTPAIDSVGYVLTNNNVQLYVNAHDPANNTHYYRWDYEETWIFHSKYFSDLVVNTNTASIAFRTPAQQIYTCFGNDASSNIDLGSTANLSQDVVYQAPLTKIPFTSEKFEEKYSILVQQYALTGDAYTFYQNLKKNTEQLGSIFDAQPSQINGNIHCLTNPNEPVIGYISATNVQSKRIFLLNSILPPLTMATYPYDCEQDTLPINGDLTTLLGPPYVFIPINLAYNKKGVFVGYLYSRPLCVDCTLRGTITQPSFWK
jgi:hypothetical protein